MTRQEERIQKDQYKKQPNPVNDKDEREYKRPIQKTSEPMLMTKTRENRKDQCKKTSKDNGHTKTRRRQNGHVISLKLLGLGFG